VSNRRCLHPDVGALLLPPGLISKWVGEAAAQFSNAPIQAFVPILVEHIVPRTPDPVQQVPARQQLIERQPIINKPMLLQNNTAGVLQGFLAEWRLNVRGVLPLQRMPLPRIGVPDEDLGDVVGVNVNRPAVTELPRVGGLFCFPAPTGSHRCSEVCRIARRSAGVVGPTIRCWRRPVHLKHHRGKRRPPWSRRG
jgi:hypothetical protein